MDCVAVGFSKNLQNGRVMRAFVNEQDIVLWRSRSGQLSAWENRCPHRGMRLSHGFVRGEALACMYHGWHYDSEGKCRYIPAHPDLDPPTTIGIEKYFSFEKGGIIWVDIRNKTGGPPTVENLTPIRSMEFHCKVERVQRVLTKFESPSSHKSTIRFHHVDQRADTVIVKIEPLGKTLHLIFQELPNFRCFLHALSADKCEVGQYKAISRCLDHLRRESETQLDILK